MHHTMILMTGITACLLACAPSGGIRKTGSAENTQKKETSGVARYRISNQIEGWVEIEDSYILFSPEGLFDIINGGAELYIEHGLKTGIYQRLSGAGNELCELFMEDFGSADNARTIYTARKEQISDPVVFEQFKEDNVIAEEFIGATGVYLRKGAFYGELTFSGFDSKKLLHEKAIPVIRFLLDKAGEPAERF